MSSRGTRIEIIPTKDGATDAVQYSTPGSGDSDILVIIKADTWGGATVALEVSPNGVDFAPVFDTNGSAVRVTSDWSGLISGHGFIRGNVTSFSGSSGLKIAAGE